MEKVPIHTESGPALGSPYTPAIRVGETLYISGQVPIDPATGRLIEGNFEDQLRQCLRNLASLLKEAGLGLDNVVKTTVFLTDLANYGTMNQIYGPYFGGIKPARSAVQVSRLPLDSLVEIEAIAVGP